MPDIRLASTDDEIASTFCVMQQLRMRLAEQDYVPLIRKLQGGGYRLAFLQDDGKVRAAAGFRINDFLAWGHSVCVDDLISDAESRSSGYGAALLGWIAEYGKAHGCTQLHPGVQRHGAHRFYLRERMDIVACHFRREL
jgi:GNAT superfamily N-acetyltransferase